MLPNAYYATDTDECEEATIPFSVDNSVYSIHFFIFFHISISQVPQKWTSGISGTWISLGLSKTHSRTD